MNRKETRKWSNGTIGISKNKIFNSFQIDSRSQPLTAMEEEHLLTRAAIPYRDPTGNSSIQVILDRREKEQKNCSLEITSQWKRRWEKTQQGCNK